MLYGILPTWLFNNKYSLSTRQREDRHHFCGCMPCQTSCACVWPLCAGENCVIREAIIDDNVSIGAGTRITNEAGVTEADRTDEGYVIQDGIVAILRNAVITPGTVI